MGTSCELCNETIDNVKEKKKHMLSHSYKSAVFQCEDCNFVGENKYTMEVHSGKNHTNERECGICEYRTESEENLELHLTTCEIYICDMCDIRMKSLSNMKAHITKEHKDKWLIHLKMNRNNE